MAPQHPAPPTEPLIEDDVESDDDFDVSDGELRPAYDPSEDGGASESTEHPDGTHLAKSTSSEVSLAQGIADATGRQQPPPPPATHLPAFVSPANPIS
jgi:hypothetical protein